MGIRPSDLQPIVVWIDMLPEDDWLAAQQAAEIFYEYPFVSQFHDPRRLIGKAVADVLGSPGKIAWDIYLLYPAGSLWEANAPYPNDWVHQMSEGGWAGKDKFCQGDALRGALRRLFNGS